MPVHAKSFQYAIFLQYSKSRGVPLPDRAISVRAFNAPCPSIDTDWAWGRIGLYSGGSSGKRGSSFGSAFLGSTFCWTSLKLVMFL